MIANPEYWAQYNPAILRRLLQADSNVLVATIVGYFLAVVGGLAVVLAGVIVASISAGKESLRLAQEGFIVSGLFKNAPLIPWNSVSEFRVQKLKQYKNAAMVVFDASNAGNLFRLQSAPGDSTFVLPDLYKLTADSLAGLMNQWRLAKVSDSDVDNTMTEMGSIPIPNTHSAVSIFVGRRFAYYEAKWAAIETRRSVWSWNWSAFLFGTLWLAYRKMYLYAWGMVGLLVIDGLCTIALHYDSSVTVPLFWGINVLIGCMGNHLYKLHVEKRTMEIAAIKTANNAQVELIRRGGTSVRICIAFLVINSVFEVALEPDLIGIISNAFQDFAPTTPVSASTVPIPANQSSTESNAVISTSTDFDPIAFIRNGVVPKYNTTTVGRAFEAAFLNPHWSTVKTETKGDTCVDGTDGCVMVQFDGSARIGDHPSGLDRLYDNPQLLDGLIAACVASGAPPAQPDTDITTNTALIACLAKSPQRVRFLFEISSDHKGFKLHTIDAPSFDETSAELMNFIYH